MHRIGINAKILMENVYKQIAKGIIDLSDRSASIVILICLGNNGGDGFVIARVLRESGPAVKVSQVTPNDRFRDDALLL